MVAAPDRLTDLDGGRINVTIRPELMHLFSVKTDLALAMN